MLFVGISHEWQYTQDPSHPRDPADTADEFRGSASTDCNLLHHRTFKENGFGCVSLFAISHLQTIVFLTASLGFFHCSSHERREKNIALRNSLKPLETGLETGRHYGEILETGRKKKFISGRLINLFNFSGFKNFAVVTPGFKAGFKRVSRACSTHHPRQAFVMHWCTLCTRLWPFRLLHR